MKKSEYSNQQQITVQKSGAAWARKLFLRMLSTVETGQLTVREQDQRWQFGNDGDLRAELVILDPGAWQKILFGGSIGAGESYIETLWDVDDLPALIRIMLRNSSVVDRMDRGLSWLVRPLQLIRHFANRNSRVGAKKNIGAHYDLGNELYQTFLDPTLLYSSAIFPDETTPLEQAQQYKLERICQLLALQPTDSVIEIGSGWGGFALHAAGRYGCHVTTTTISDAQYEEARKRVDAAGLSDKITLLRDDYRDLTGRYDKLVSIEMIEAVGHRYLPFFLRKCGELLQPDGRMLLQAITIADQRYDSYARGVDFIQRHIFPGGCLLSNSRMLRLIAEQTDMVVRKIDDFGFDYARTLQEWRKRFAEATPRLEQLGYDRRFRRMWNFYFCYCEGGFLERAISVVHLVATRPQNRQR